MGHRENCDLDYAAKETSTVLFVGTPDVWRHALLAQMPAADFVFARLEDFDLELLRKVDPSIVLSPLLSAAYDPTELIKWLQDFDYLGQFAAITGPIPSPEIVRQEIQSFGPDIRFELIILQRRPNYLH